MEEEDRESSEPDIPDSEVPEQDELPKPFQINRTNIKSIEVTEEGLANIEGLTCYDEQTFEMGCIEQLEQHIHTDNEQTIAPWQTLQEPEEETEQEIAVRLGEITPFGSILGRTKNIPQPQTFREKTIKKITKRSKRYVKESLGTDTDYCHWSSRPGNLPGEDGTIDFNEPSGSEYEPSDNEPVYSDDEEFDYDPEPPKPKKMKIKREKISEDENDSEADWYSSDEETRRKRKNYKERDDGDEGAYQRRVKHWEKSRPDVGHFEEFHKFDFFGFKIPSEIWEKLFKYQKVGVQWLYELNETPCGGILGDEMGMGKTIQVISFLAAVHVSKIRNKHTGIPGLGPCLIVCPVTIMHQWVSEFHKWYPPIRVAVLHGTGSYSGSRTQLIKDMIRSNGVVITSYSSLVNHLENLMVTKWHYVILDEGHTIRNPDSQVTLAAKCLRTPHRIILTGSPMQNKLQELWSLFDFVYPGKLGTLPMFMEYYGDAIIQGGFATASEAQVLAGYKCAKTLKEIISPFMLRRMKKDVMEHLKLPNKSEQVLFCKLTEEQVSQYRGYINSGDVSDILSGRLKIFVGLIKLRKICNHPDLFSGGPKLLRGDREEDIPEELRFGHWSKAGKMIVLSTLLKMWFKQKHRVLLFSQSKQMLGIFEMYLKENNYKYLKMDGTTHIGSRQTLVNKFNSDLSYFILILTTKVGGFGINLTGADRVVIYDPDWNPATDIQARERAWRIGQDKQVTVYRLITAGTIEEKIYHRQIFKQFLANRVLNDPKQRRFFKENDLMELFTLQDQKSESTETSAIFAGTDSEIKMDKKKKIKHFDLKPQRPTKTRKSQKQNTGVLFSKDKIEAMKKLAQKINQKFHSEHLTCTVTSGSLEQMQDKDKSNESTENNNYETHGNEIERDTKKDENNSIKDEALAQQDETISNQSETSNKVNPLVSSENDEIVPNNIALETTNSSLENEGNPSKDNGSVGANIQPSESMEKHAEKRSRSRDPRLQDKHSSGEEYSSKYHKKKKKKSKQRQSSVDGEYVPYLVGKEKPKKEKTDEQVRQKQDDYILEKLFSKSNICTAMKHDKIMEEGGSDYVVVEKEAEEIAKKAIEAIKESRKACHSAAAGIPTWTGSNGSFKVPTLLLDKIKKRKQAMANRLPAAPSSSEMFKKANGNSETALIEQIIEFVSSRNNWVTSAAMVDKFRNVENAALFKALLNAVCTLKKDPAGRKFWSLKHEFRDGAVGPSTSSS